MRSNFLIFSMALAALTLPFNASAAKIPFETTGIISYQASIRTTLTVDTAGDYDATLSDLSLGELKFRLLGMSISTAKHTLGWLEAPGTMHFKLEPGLYYLHILGVNSGAYHTGVYGVSITPTPISSALPEPSSTPVPVPAAGWLLLSGLAALGWKARKK